MFFKFSSVFTLFFILNYVHGNYNGPFLMWGVDNLKNMKISAMNIVDNNKLLDLYKESMTVIVFLRNSSERINGDKFPDFKNIIDHTEWLYLPQHRIDSDPIDYNVNTEIINLYGTQMEQDNEITSVYNSAIQKYGNKNVLGILSTNSESHSIKKRYSEESQNKKVKSEKRNDNYIYYSEGKAIIYTTAAPLLKMGDDTNSTAITLYELDTHGSVTVTDNGKDYAVIVEFMVLNKEIKLRFIFTIFSYYWHMDEVEVISSGKTTILNIVRRKPAALIGESYHCSQSLSFKNGTTELILENIQVQPKMNGSSNFSRAIDCVGFTSGPILSGIMIVFLLSFVLSIAICAILDIKTPNRFESTNKINN